MGVGSATEANFGVVGSGGKVWPAKGIVGFNLAGAGAGMLIENLSPK